MMILSSIHISSLLDKKKVKQYWWQTMNNTINKLDNKTIVIYYFFIRLALNRETGFFWSPEEVLGEALPVSREGRAATGLSTT